MFHDEHAHAGHVTSKVITEDAFDRELKQARRTRSSNLANADNNHPLDHPETRELFNKLMSYYLNELDRQAENRRLMAADEDCYDGEQWDERDIITLKQRGQTPLVFNVTATSINWLIGTERRGRTDAKILPRHKDGAQAAQRKTDLMKYLADTNRTEFSISDAFEECVKAGLGWLECGLQSDDEGEPIYENAVSWRSMLYDSAATKKDLSDGRYIFRSKWSDVDVVKALFPDRKAVIEQAASTTLDHQFFHTNDGDDAMDSAEEELQDAAYQGGMHFGHYSGRRERVRLIEGWFRIPVEEEFMAGGEFSGEVFDAYSDGHINQIIMGRAKVKKRVTFRVYVMIMTNAGPLWMSKSPYRHNRFPFTPIWCYRRAKNGLPYGVIRNMRDVQADINKRASKALHIMSTSKTIVDDDAVEDWDEFEEEVARADAILKVKPNRRLELNADRGMDDAHLEFMTRSIMMVQSITGVTDESLGRSTNAKSGKAIIARQEQGALATAPIFDNLRFARQVHGEKTLSLTEQFMDAEKQFRITNRRGTPTHVTINDGLPENDIIQHKADFIISEHDWNATVRQSQAMELLDLLKMLAPTSPGIVPMLLDLLVEMMDVPQVDEIVARIRQITGATDPDQDPNEVTPEQQQQEQAKAMQAEMEQRASKAALAETEAKAAEAQAKAQKTAVEAEKIAVEARKAQAQLPAAEIETADKAFELALKALTTPAAAQAADMIVEETKAEAYQPA